MINDIPMCLQSFDDAGVRNSEELAALVEFYHQHPPRLINYIIVFGQQPFILRQRC